MRRLRCCARLRPSGVRVRIRLRSTSIKPPSMAIISRLVLVPMSVRGRVGETLSRSLMTIRLMDADDPVIGVIGLPSGQEHLVLALVLAHAAIPTVPPPSPPSR
jgi:hypothetical protein